MILTKRKEAENHIADLVDMFTTLREYRMKLNRKKYAFRVNSGKFLRYVVTQHSIKANLDKIKALINMESHQKLRDIQRVNDSLLL